MKVTLIALGVFALFETLIISEDRDEMPPQGGISSGSALFAMVKAESCAVASDCMALACKGMEACEMGTCTCTATGSATTKSPDGVLHGNHCRTVSDCGPHLHNCVSGTAHCRDGHCHCSHH